MFITHCGRQQINREQNIYGPIRYYYENLANYFSRNLTYVFILCCPKNTLICKLDTFYTMEKLVYGHFTHILHK